MNEGTILAAMATIMLALIGAVWSALRGEIAEHKSRIVALEREVTRLSTEHARSEERDKSFDAGITRLTKAIDDFDTRIGAQIDNLSRVVEGLTRKYTPPGGYKYIGGPVPKKKDEE